MHRRKWLLTYSPSALWYQISPHLWRDTTTAIHCFIH